ncbi:hypothetical protein BD309DRAFT_892542 [Dichomitus squalens]|uniref:Uncharacterized protein n=1 Tax=Dichomitus squalens TaxID=114155 RepID=A0A4Q9PX11_9APHY|nr:hypothetical protein BD309DRAFT_892542 [Dichomitus squalens]TBU59237.1 hypothetical protein BD310DRAFT_958402 [Dichomitus squalens]
MDDSEQLGRTRSATNFRIWSASVSSSSHAPVPRPNRAVANADQVALLKKYVARTGMDGTKEHLLAEIALETGLDAKWVRQWVLRQLRKDKGRSKGKGRRSTPSSSGPAREVPSEASRSPSEAPEDPSTTTPPQKIFAAPVSAPARATTGPGLTLGVLEPGPKTRQNSGNSMASSTMATVGTTSPVIAYELEGIPLMYQYYSDVAPASLPVSHGLSTSIPAHEPAPSTLTAPFSSETNYQHATTDTSTPVLQANAAQWHAFTNTYPQTLRQAELLAQAAYSAPAPGPSGLSAPHLSPATPSLSSSRNAEATFQQAAPGGLSPGSAYLYRIFNENVASPLILAVPSEAHASDVGEYMEGLTRPYAAPAGLEATLSVATLPSPLVSMLAPVTFPAYPVAYQLPYSALVDMTKGVRIRGTATEGDPGLSACTRTDVLNAVTVNSAQDISEILGLNFTYGSASATAGNVLEILRATPVGAIHEEEEETEDEEEVVTPGEVSDFTPSLLQHDKGKEKSTDARVAIVEAPSEVGTP